MSSSRTSARRILRNGNGADTLVSAARILVAPPGDPAGAGGPAGAGSGLADMLERARQEGREEGYRAATEEMAAAEAAGRAAQLRRVADALVSAARDAAAARREAVEVAGAEAAGLAFELAEAFLQRELAVGRPAVDAVTRALRLVPEGQDLVVRVNPCDAVSPEELAGLVPDVAVSVVADPRIEAGGCVVQAGPSRIDTQLGAALQRVREVLVELYPDADPVLGGVDREEVA